MANSLKPQDIKSVALFTIEGELDNISGPGQTKVAHDLCSSIPAANKQHFIAKKYGYYGIFFDRCWHELIAPNITAFIKANG